MKRRHRVHHRTHRTLRGRTGKSTENYLVVVRSWMLVVLFAIMLGVGAIVGTFLNGELNKATPTVAGASSAR